MLSVEEALARVMTAATPLPDERIPIDAAYGRVLAEPIQAPLDVPPWDNSAMDGFALKAEDTGDAGASLRVVEHIPAGGWPTVPVTPGTCARIMTGAPVPEGADAVVMIEQTDAWEDRSAGQVGGQVQIRVAARPHQNIRDRGNDIASGSAVMAPGHSLGPAEVGILAALGLPSVRVRQRPLVALLSTGDEVVEPGWPLGDGQIHSSNTHALAGLVIEAGGQPLNCGIASDSEEALAAGLRRCLRADLILTTGGVSVGDFDFVKDAFEGGAAGDAALDFWKVRMKPGKPLAFGTIQGRTVFGLPGNPVSCMVNFLQFVRPVMRSMLGDPTPFLPVVEAAVEGAVKKRPGRALMERVRLRQEEGRIIASSYRNQSSGALSSMMHADGLLMLGAEAGGLEEGEIARVQVLRWGWMDGASPAYGW